MQRSIFDAERQNILMKKFSPGDDVIKKEYSPILKLLWVMMELRNKKTGCPWDIEQTFKTILPYTIEEAYEVADAIENDDIDQLKEELGDLLLQVVFHSRIAEELGKFNFFEVASGISEKMIVRHPHVFSDEAVENLAEQSNRWEAQKVRERLEKSKVAHSDSDGIPENFSIIGGIARTLPALKRAEKIQKQAARVGFDWVELKDVINKIREELSELENEIPPSHSEKLADEIGDLLFSCVNLARHLSVDPEAALRLGNKKFEKRFKAVEKEFLRKGQRIEDVSQQKMNIIWDKVKYDNA